MSETDFKVGDVVILKSGGPTMTVCEIDDDEDMIYCQWFVENKILETADFPADSLEHYDATGGLFA